MSDPIRGQPPPEAYVPQPLGAGVDGRLLLIFAPSGDDPGYVRQKELLAEADGVLAEQHVTVIEVVGSQVVSGREARVTDMGDATALRARWHVDPSVFTVVLATSDGTEKLRANQPVSAGPLYVTFDGSPGRHDAKPHSRANGGDGGG